LEQIGFLGNLRKNLMDFVPFGQAKHAVIKREILCGNDGLTHSKSFEIFTAEFFSFKPIIELSNVGVIRFDYQLCNRYSKS
jgi:hypothetical protein